MIIFIFVVSSYSLANLYTYFKISSLIEYGLFAEVLLGSAILFMTFSPVVIPIYSNRGSEKAVRYFSYIGYTWLAFLVPFFPLTALLDFYNFFAPYIAELISRDKVPLLVSQKNTFLIPFCG